MKAKKEQKNIFTICSETTIMSLCVTLESVLIIGRSRIQLKIEYEAENVWLRSTELSLSQTKDMKQIRSDFYYYFIASKSESGEWRHRMKAKEQSEIEKYIFPQKLSKSE